MVGTSLRLFPAVHTYSVSVSYTWWFVFILSSAAARGGAISANSQRWVLHQPRTCYSFSPSYLFPSMPARCVGMSLCVMFLPCMCGDLLSSYFCTVSRILRRGLISLLDSVAGLGAWDWHPFGHFLPAICPVGVGTGSPVLLPNFVFLFWMWSSGSFVINFIPLFCTALESSCPFYTGLCDRTYRPDMDSAGDLEIRHALAQQGILLGRQQEEIQVSHQALNSLSQQLTAISQRLDQLQIDPSMDPAAAAPDLEEAAPPRRSEPRLNPPAPYSGEPTSCRSFLSQCSLTFSLQPSCFPTDESRIAFVIMHLAGSAREWGTAMWDNKNECCSSYSIFSQELRKVFDRSALGNEAARALSLLRQGTRTVSDYAIEFRTLAASSGWNSRALWDHFLHGLAEHIKDEIYSLELPPSLDGLVELATRVDFRLALRSQHRNMENRHESFDLPPSARGATSPRVGFSEEEPMQIGRAHLTARERRHRIAHGLCLYCGEAGHMVTTCPYKRQPLSGERSRTVSVTAALLPSGGRTTLPAVLQSEGVTTRWQLLLTQERRGISWTLSWLDAGIFLFFL